MFSRMVFLSTILSLVLALALAFAAPPAAASKPTPWARWDQSDPTSRRVLDHGAWQRFLDRYLLPIKNGPNRVRYAAAAKDGKPALGAYIAWLARVPVIGLNKGEQRAYWINLYNALTVKVVLDHYPLASIRDISISPGWFTKGPWGKKLVVIGGTPVSLDDIEHRILRPIWKDARIHYVLTCASLGCPELMAEAFSGFNTARLMQEAAVNFVGSPRGVHFDDDGLVVSSLYRWYADDFGGWPKGVIRHLIKYAPPETARRLAIRSVIAGHGYDWALNDAKTLKARR